MFSMTNFDPSKGPFPLHATPYSKHGKKPEYYMSTLMCLAHNLQIRSLNAIYIQATSVSSATDISDFLIYCQCWYEVLDRHHRLEEEFLFPEMEKRLNLPGIMDESVEQHRVFHDKFEMWGKACYNTQPEHYNGVNWRKMIDAFAVPLMKHLHDEVKLLEDLAKHDPEGKVMIEIGNIIEEKVMEETDKSRSLPMALGSADSTFEGGIHDFPPVPWFAVILVDWIYARKYRGAWRFSPSDMHGRPRPLRFVAGN